MHTLTRPLYDPNPFKHEKTHGLLKLRFSKTSFELEHSVNHKHGSSFKNIPKMKAAVLNHSKQPLQLETRPDLNPSPGHVIVRLKNAALNRRDYWITQGLYPGIRTPVILGSDGAGTVAEIGEGVDSNWLTKEVIIQPGIHWGGDETAQSEAFHILGMPTDGTFATHVQIPVENLHTKPENLNWAQSAALPLAGLTAYRALFSQGGLTEGMNILITGAGGGVSAFALQFSLAAGANVWVTSSSASKIEKAIKLGAKGGANYKEENWSNTLAKQAGSFQLIIDSAGGSGYHALIELAAPSGRIVNYGATTGNPKNIDMFKVFWKQLRIQGTTMGSPQDFQNMIHLVESKNIQPLIEKAFDLLEVNDALAMMRHSEQFGKIVLNCDC